MAPLAFEMGGLHDFAQFELFLFLGKGTGTPGWRGSIGYGKICYIGRYAIKFSINLLMAADPRQGGYQLGVIDNHNKTVYILGWEPEPTFMGSAGRSGTRTYQTNTLAVTYSQRELSFMPKLSLQSRSKCRKNHFELAVGYNVPIQDFGGLNFIQNGSDPSYGSVSNVIPGPSILNDSLSTHYDNKPLKAPLYRYGGVYLELKFDVLEWGKILKKQV